MTTNGLALGMIPNGWILYEWY